MKARRIEGGDDGQMRFIFDDEDQDEWDCDARGLERERVLTDDGLVYVDTVVEAAGFEYGNVHKCWGMVSLNGCGDVPGFAVDFVVLIDMSASMIVDNKLNVVKECLLYLLGKLSSKHRITIICFNHTVTELCSLLYCTEETRDYIKDLFDSIEPSGSTNISEALFMASEILASRVEERVSSLMLITDGISNRGLTREETIRTLQDLSLPDGCICNTFGFGEDHDSKLLHAIALKTQGMYYYVQSPEFISSVLENCVNEILETVVKHVSVKLFAQDGSRIIAFHVPLVIAEKEKAKQYHIKVGSLSCHQTKSVLFRLSLRKQRHVMSQPLVKFLINYEDIFGNVTELERWITVERTELPSTSTIPKQLEENILRCASASAISEAIELCNQMRFSEAREKLEVLLSTFKNTKSILSYTHIVNSIFACIEAMRDITTFQTGIHAAHAYSCIFYMEKHENSDHSIYLNHIEDGYLNEDLKKKH
eukprot:TRINITY_DN8490_c0_g1_i1.p1 TRINITY_DN8490_c0_g1~~TRINITY_DN8490_c0_g1_i1.p1  ORF type:complete len:480 (-),score=69.98 TRINITY_DN8490_c0_g1_i1:37-1476(-)